MADAIELELPFTSPYKATRLFIIGGRASFGIWRPLEITMDGDEEEVAIQEGQEGTCEFVAGMVYGDRALWRVIAHANLIDFPMEQIVPGTVLKIPKPERVRAALLATARRQEST